MENLDRFYLMLELKQPLQSFATGAGIEADARNLILSDEEAAQMREKILGGKSSCPEKIKETAEKAKPKSVNKSGTKKPRKPKP